MNNHNERRGTMEATIKDYNNVYDESNEIFNISLLHFREVMCSTKYTLEQKDSAFESLMTDYFRLKLDKKQIDFFKAVKLEWEIRKLYEVLA